MDTLNKEGQDLRLNSSAANQIIKEDSKLTPKMLGYQPRNFGQGKIGTALGGMFGDPGSRGTWKQGQRFGVRESIAPELMIGGTQLRKNGRTAVRKQSFGQTTIDDVDTGGGGDDTLTGGGGNDTLNLGGNNDSINLGTGTDSINLGTGTDSINLGTGINTILGGDSTTPNVNYEDLLRALYGQPEQPALPEGFGEFDYDYLLEQIAGLMPEIPEFNSSKPFQFAEVGKSTISDGVRGSRRKGKNRRDYRRGRNVNAAGQFLAPLLSIGGVGSL
jgi:hypothetical protein